MPAKDAVIASVESEEAILACHPVMFQLRPHIPREVFLERVKRQRAEGFRMACVESNGVVVAVAGYRILNYLAWGKAMYVDDLVTDANARSLGYGSMLFDWLVNQARREGCEQFHLDSGVQRFDAHRFYLRKRMRISSHHFAIEFDAT